MPAFFFSEFRSNCSLSLASTPDFPPQGRDFFAKKSLMKLPVAVSKPREEKILCGDFNHSIHLVANQGASRYPGTAPLLKQAPVFSGRYPSDAVE